MRRFFCLTSVMALLSAASVTEAGTPKLQRVSPPGLQRGKTVEVQLQGRYLEKAREVMLYEPGITVESVELLEEVEVNGRKVKIDAGTRVKVRLAVAEDCALGLHGLRLRTDHGISDYQRFFVGPFANIDEDESNQKRNDKRELAQAVPLNTTVTGRMLEQADVDLYRIEAKQGQRLSAEIEATRLGVDQGIPDLYVAILNADGKKLVAADDSALFVQDPVVSTVAPADGTYFVEVRHALYSAQNDLYRLHVGTFARPTAVYPAGGQSGQDLAVKLIGDPKGVSSQTVKLPTLPSPQGHQAPTSQNFAYAPVADDVPAPTPNTLRVSPFPNVLEVEPNNSQDQLVATAEKDKTTAASLPAAFNGVIDQSGDIDCFRFTAKKGERYRIQCLANAIGSPVDPTIWVKQITSKGGPQRATDSRPNQLGLAPYSGMNRDTLDPTLDFTAPADGEYVLGVEDDRGSGGADYVYRVEVTPEVDTVYVYIPQEAENVFSPQSRQSVGVPAGGRYNTTMSIINSNRPYNGDLELVALNLPEGVTMTAPRITPSMIRVPVVFEAAADAKLQGKLIEVIVKPAKTEGSDDKAAPQLYSGFRQSIAMNASGNNDFYLFNSFDRLAIAVTEAAPFSIEVDEPKSSLVQNGEMTVKFKIHRADGYDGPVNVAMEWKPNGISTGTPVTIPAGKTEGEYLLGAARNATAGTYPVTLTVTNGGERPGYRDGANRTYVAAKPFKLTVAEPHIDAKFPRASIERGKTANLTVKLNHLKPFDGKAKATLARLPRGVQLVEPVREVAPGDKEVTFTLLATEECLTGGYQGITLDVTVTEDGQAVRQLSGSGTLRIDTERGVAAKK